MIIASTLFLIVGIVTFVIGVFARDDVGLIVVSIGASAVAALTLAVGVVRDRKRLAAEGLSSPEPSTFTEAAPTPGEPVAPIVSTERASLVTEAPVDDLEDADAATTRALPRTAEPITLTVDEPVPARESASVRAARSSAAKTTAKKTAAKKTAASKATAKKSAAKKSTAKKPAAKKTAAKKPAKKTAAKKPAAKKTAKKSSAPSPPPPPPPPGS